MGFPQMGAGVPGVIGASEVSGMNLAILGTAIYANLASKGARKAAAKLAERELGRAILKIAFTKRNISFAHKAWTVAFTHIAEHFGTKAAIGKATHGVFLKALRNRAAVEGLVKSAVGRSSNRVISRRFVHQLTIGEPVIIVEREFGEVIGEAFKMEGGKIVKATEKVIENGVERVIWNGDCKVLRVIYNIYGRPITAFPIRAIGEGL